MALQSNRLGMGHQQAVASQTLSAGLCDFNQHSLGILRCTAKALVNSPGGLRFKAGTQPWLEGLSMVRPVLAAVSERKLEDALLASSD